MKNVFAEYPLRHSMDLVELGARSMDLVDLEFLELGCLAGKKWSGAVFWIWSCVELSQTRPKSKISEEICLNLLKKICLNFRNCWYFDHCNVVSTGF
jgi:hypothetical protein